jgi:hypothetical protein
MFSDITKIKFRQDTSSNWETSNPILASGEPGFEINENGLGKLKIGDGKTTWKDLNYAANPLENGIVDIPDDEAYLNVIFGRALNHTTLKPEWQVINIPKPDERLTFADILKQEYSVTDNEEESNEISLKYNIKVPEVTSNGIEYKEYPAYAIKKYYLISANEDESNYKTITIKGKIKNIIDFGGTIKRDNSHIYALPGTHGATPNNSTKNEQYCLVDVWTDNEDNNNQIKIRSVSGTNRNEAPLDIWIIYTKEI